jgi:hypothetical protein
MAVISYTDAHSSTEDLFSDDLELLVQEVGNQSYYFDSVLQEIKDMIFIITEDPENDFVSFNNLYAKVTAYFSRASSILISIETERAVWQKFHSRAKRMYKLKENIFLQDEVIQALRNKELQKATVESRMPEVVRMKILIEDVLDNLTGIAAIVKIKCDELDKACTNLNRQQRVVESMIGLGYPVNVKRQ